MIEFLLPFLGLFGITAAVLGGERLADNIPTPKPNQPGLPVGVPSYVPLILVAVGAALLYKYGAKKLKV